MKEKIYQIFIIGENTTEYYTFNQPTIKDGKIICKSLLQKAKVVENIMGENLEEFYKVECGELSVDSKDFIDSFELTDGVAIKLLSIEDATFIWLNNTKQEALNLLKDKVLNYYQQTVPNLVKGIEHLQHQLKIMQSNQGNNNLIHTAQPNKNKLLIP